MSAIPLISRDDAHARGLTFYFTGKPCRKRGHVGQRYVSNGCCKTCLNGMYKRTMGSGITHDLNSFRPEKLVAPVDASRDDLIRLRHYLQTCIYAYAVKNWPKMITPGVQLAIDMHTRSTPQVQNPAEIP